MIGPPGRTKWQSLFCPTRALVAVLPICAADEETTSLMGDDVSTRQENTSDWQIVAQVKK